MIHPDQCNECGRFAFESCGKPKGRCPRKVPVVMTAGAVTEAPTPAMAVQPPQPAAARRQQARVMGYTGDICPTCSNFTMIRNGACLKCDTCGSTTGCS